MNVCVAVPTNEYSDKLEKCILSLFDLSYRDYEIIIIDDSKEGSIHSKLEKYKGKMKVLRSEAKGPSYARNLAARHTEAEYIAFTDSDCIVEREWISELLKGFAPFPEAVACGGRQEVPGDATAFEKKVFRLMRKVGLLTDYMRRPDKGKGVYEVRHNPACNVMYKRQVFLKEGGFPEGIWPGEDVALDYTLRKKKYLLLYNPRAVVYHYRSPTTSAFCAMMSRYGKVQGILTRRYGVFRPLQLCGFLAPFVLLTALSLIVIQWKVAIALVIIAGIATLCYVRSFMESRLLFLGGMFWLQGFWRGLLSPYKRTAR